MAALSVAILGFGFSGLMVTTHLVRTAAAGTTVYIISDTPDGAGVAYSTRNTAHLLNVPAARMGAFPDTIDDFLLWLMGAEGAQAKQALGIAREYGAADFVPRALYAAYLSAIWRRTQEEAAARGVQLKLVASEALAVRERDGLAVLTARGDAIAVDRVVFATGNENRPILPGTEGAQLVQDPWARGAFDEAGAWTGPVMLMGTGLTAVDTIFSLRSAGYTGEIIAFSRHGLLPRAHAPVQRIFSFDQHPLLLQSTLAAMLRMVRAAVREHGEWRPVIDALRPHTQALWQRLTTRDQKRFLTRLGTYWNVHRHRMAPEVAARVEAEMASGTVRVLAAAHYRAQVTEGQLQVTVTTTAGQEEQFAPARLINCTGPQLAVARSSYTLLTQAVADGFIEPHATGLGVAVDPALRAWGAAYPNLYVMGALATGQLLESTAVPELRGQARQVAEDITA